MKIKRVEIVGFKSFVDKVSLDFQEGVTAILGPNGCGKSNIVDAIRWAMGEQNAKHLRGRSMEDIIFGGSESRRPLGMAEVSMIFSNEERLGPPAFHEYSEIQVTRRLYRSGESEYLLNKTPCRLLDITELFMDTGIGARAYSIIEQGKIGMILNAKPEERRAIIEEAAGVTKFKSRKKSALRKIEATRQNLLRLGDIVSEVKRQLGSLKRQAQKAERFREYREELRSIEVRFAARRFRELADALEKLSREESRQQEQFESLSGRLAENEARMEEMRLQQVASEQEATRGQERVFHLATEIQKVESRLEFGEKEVENLQRQRERLGAERDDVRRRLSELGDEEAEVARAGETLEADLRKEGRSLGEGETLLEEFSGREQEVGASLEQARSALFALLTELSRLGSRQEEVRRRLQSLQDRLDRNRGEAVAVREQAAESQELAGTVEEALRSFRERRSALQQEKEEAQETLTLLRRQFEENESLLQAAREEFSRRSSRLESLQQLEKALEGYGGGVRALLGQEAFRDRFELMAADILDVPEELEPAVEAVLGERLQALVAGDMVAVGEALEFLRDQEGRCTFLLPGDAPRGGDEVAEGAPLLGRVVPRVGHEASAAKLLEGVRLVESLEPFFGRELPRGAILVTAAGGVLTHRGEVSAGGKPGREHGLLHRKREMKELSAAVQALEQDVRGLQVRRAQLREEAQAAEEEAREIEGALHHEDIRILDSEKDLQRLHQEGDRLQERLEVLSLEEDQLHGERSEIVGQMEEADRGREAKEAQKVLLEEEVGRLQEELQVVRRDAGVIRERVTSLKVAVASLREREEAGRRNLERLGRLRQELLGRLALLDGQGIEGENEQERLRREGERLRTELEVLLGRREEERARYEKLRDRFEESAARIDAQEEVLKELRRQTSAARDELGVLQLQRQELALESDHLRRGILDRYRLDLSERPSEEGEDFDSEAAERRASELRRLIDGIGEVNLTAIDEYRELEERHQFLSGQQEDLRQSLDGLQAAITKINRTTRRRFRETFEQVNAKFQEVFPRLFRGGRAELKLTDEEDLLETGIEIIVQPPGKKLQNVSLLSGGEKALTAVALIFSIFLIKPSPFCMLDEVDAPLDDANIGRFNDMIRTMAQHSQFIIITHNKRTMEVADTLYGVTMEEPGISKTVSVRMNDFQG